ncbi:MAG: DUF1328 domain-containing protein [Anaerolineae bacterium]
MRAKLAWATTLLVVAFIVALFGLRWNAEAVAEIAKGLFFMLLIWFMASHFGRRSTA